MLNDSDEDEYTAVDKTMMIMMKSVKWCLMSSDLVVTSTLREVKRKMVGSYLSCLLSSV